MKKFFGSVFICLLCTVLVGCSGDIQQSVSTKNKLPEATTTEQFTTTEPWATSTTGRITTSKASTTTSTITETTTQTTTTTKRPTTTTKTATTTTVGGGEMTNNCRLIIRGKEVYAQGCVIDYEQQHLASIPLLLVVRELGAVVEWTDNATIQIRYGGGEYVLDISRSDFGIHVPPGTIGAVRKMTDDEIVIDSTSATGIVRWLGADITIDKYTATIYID